MLEDVTNGLAPKNGRQYDQLMERENGNTELKIPRVSAVDLFCGAGGLTRGLLDGDIHVSAGIDLDAACRYPYEHNNGVPFIERSVSEVSLDELNALFGSSRVRLLAGCAPCQPFSTFNQGKDLTKDSKWRLLDAFGAMVQGVLPELVTMENVPQLKKHDVFADFVKTLEGLGYHCWYSTVYAPEYGIPQARKRLVLLASRLGPIELLRPTHLPDQYPTVESAIGNLPRLRAGEVNKADPLHRSARLSKINFERMKASKPGGTWRDWRPDLVTPCHRSDSGKSYSGVYGRMSPKLPAPTITTQFYNFGSGRFGHPTQDRALSLREGALLQSFPPNYQFITPGKKFHISKLGTLIGNAVPVRLGEIIALSLHKHLDEQGIQR